MSENKVAVVTGAAKGLGKGYMEALLERGYQVYFCDVDSTEGEKTRAALASKYGHKKVSFQLCDVTNDDDIKAFFDHVANDANTIDVVVNNAGIVDEINWKRSVDINVNGLITGTFLAMEKMRECNGERGGFILNVSSMAGLIGAPPAPVYAATKHAVIGFTRSLSEMPAVKKSRIRLACICPAFADTDIISSLKERSSDVELISTLIEEYGMMTIGRVVEAFVKLLTDEDNNGKALAVTPESMYYHRFDSKE